MAKDTYGYSSIGDDHLIIRQSGDLLDVFLGVTGLGN